MSREMIFYIENETRLSSEAAFENIRDDINGLIGLKPLKELVNVLCQMALNISDRELLTSMFLTNYLFSIDKGCGFTKCVKAVARLFANIVGEGVNVYNTDLVRSPKKDADKYVPAAKAERGKANYFVEIIDISKWVGETNSEEFIKNLEKMHRFTNNTLYIFRIPELEKKAFDKVYSALNDVLCVKPVKFQPITFEEMWQYAGKRASKMNFEMLPESKESFGRAIAEEKMDGRFYGFQTVRKVVQEIIFKKLYNNPAEQSRTITSEDVERALGGDSLMTSEQMLDKICGLEEVKNKLREIVEQFANFKKYGIDAKTTIHMCFEGSPGTGKTSVARILGRMLTEKGVLKNGGFCEYPARELVGMHVGYTEDMVKNVVVDALGSVLFIDEAYLLYNNTTKNDYGTNVLAVLQPKMENHRTDLVVIMAGYAEEMEQMLNGTKGLRSRFAHVITFPNYSREELYNIYLKMVGECYETEGGFEKVAKSFFENLPENVVTSKDFGNARYVRNIFERTQMYAVNRSAKSGEEKVIFCSEDFNKAVTDKDLNPRINTKTSKWRVLAD